jgi:hypothetical protein
MLTVVLADPYKYCTRQVDTKKPLRQQEHSVHDTVHSGRSTLLREPREYRIYTLVEMLMGLSNCRESVSICSAYPQPFPCQ